jgi:acyl-coenzyme A thioesterase PaaI-like protein
VCKSRIIRAGSRIVVARIDLFNDREQVIATGTGTYLIG